QLRLLGARFLVSQDVGWHRRVLCGSNPVFPQHLARRRGLFDGALRWPGARRKGHPGTARTGADRAECRFLGGGLMPRRVLLSWSSGKDSAWTLHVLRQQPDIEVVGLLTTFNEAADRVAMHAVRRPLVEAQAAAAGLPLWSVRLPWPCSNAAYEDQMSAVIDRAGAQGVTHIAFGDLFLEDIRNYRIRQLSGTGVEPLFPLWGLDTPALARSMLAAGLRAVLTCV